MSCTAYAPPSSKSYSLHTSVALNLLIIKVAKHSGRAHSPHILLEVKIGLRTQLTPETLLKPRQQWKWPFTITIPTLLITKSEWG